MHLRATLVGWTLCAVPRAPQPLATEPSPPQERLRTHLEFQADAPPAWNAGEFFGELFGGGR